ncbi:MAG: K(+)-transporting ATPase subunit C [Candidatus Hadarchaeia archaeon]
MKNKLKDLSVSIRLLLLALVVFSLAYSGIIGMIGQAIWSGEAEGSLVREDGKVVGSELIGQEFNGPEYFHSRPSSIGYDALRSGSQNLGPVENSGLESRVEDDLENISNYYGFPITVPSDFVTESGSALDPHITVRSAMFQIPRVSSESNIPEEKLESLVEKYSEDKLLGIYGTKRVNVLNLNLEIYKMMEED